MKGGMVHYYYPAKNNDHLNLYDFAVVENEHGPQLSRVVHPLKQVAKDMLPEKIKPLLRKATDKDLAQFETNTKKEKDAYKLCRQKALEKKLAMKLVDVSYSLDARKAVFYFTAENRVDFRELVKDLAHALRVKIEMRQIGVRDEARRLGGVGCCGRTLCCCTFLKDFVSVSIRMAKEQNLSLNPAKVSGLCGRLMCCLSYEYYGKGKGQKGKGQAGEQDTPVLEAVCELAETQTPACTEACNGPCQAAREEAATAKPNGNASQPVPAAAAQVAPSATVQAPTGGTVQVQTQDAQRPRKHKRRPPHKHRRFKGKNGNSQGNNPKAGSASPEGR